MSTAVCAHSAVAAPRRATCVRRTRAAVVAAAGQDTAAAATPATLLGRRHALGLSLAASTLVVSRTAPAWAAPAVGDAAPAFDLPSVTAAGKGANVSLKQLLGSGKYTVLYFYNADQARSRC